MSRCYWCACLEPSTQLSKSPGYTPSDWLHACHVLLLYYFKNSGRRILHHLVRFYLSAILHGMAEDWEPQLERNGFPATRFIGPLMAQLNAQVNTCCEHTFSKVVLLGTHGLLFPLFSMQFARAHDLSRNVPSRVRTYEGYTCRIA